MRQQHTVMMFDPAFGTEKPFPSDAGQYRGFHGPRAWLFDPWTGKRRTVAEIGLDVNGQLIVPEGEKIYFHPEPQNSSPAVRFQEAISNPVSASQTFDYWGRIQDQNR